MNENESGWTFGQNSLLDRSAKIGWAINQKTMFNCQIEMPEDIRSLSAGDVVAVRVTKVGSHKRIYQADRRFSTLYQGDIIIGGLGYRYATDAFHADTLDCNNLAIITNGALIGTVSDKNSKMRPPTSVELVGRVIDQGGYTLSVEPCLHHTPKTILKSVPLVLSVGSGMNAGKTTLTSRVCSNLSKQGVKVALLKFTGSVSHRDVDEYAASGAHFIRDFSSYGILSTYQVSRTTLNLLCQNMINDAVVSGADMIIAEIADGLLQPETNQLLRDQLLKNTVSGVLAAANCSLSALYLVNELSAMGYSKIVLSGTVTNAPLFIRECRDRSDYPIFDCITEAGKISEVIKSWESSETDDKLAPLLSKVNSRKLVSA